MGKREYADWKLDCVACGDDFWHREYAGTSKPFPDLCRECAKKQANGQRIEVPKPVAPDPLTAAERAMGVGT